MTKEKNNRLSRLATRLGIAGIALAATLGIAACGGDDDDGGGGGGGEVALVAYSTPQQAFEEGIIPAFQNTDAGSGVEFTTSFGSSGDQRRAVEAGQEADFVDFSLEPDMLSLVESGLVAEDWNSGPTKGIITDSVVTLSVRPGNPENIQTWEDIVESGAEVITPNPATSGGAKWNIMAAYGSQIQQGKSEQAALDFVAQILEQTSVLDDSARDSLQTFASGKGDVLIGYENEAIQAQDEGIELEYVIPEQTILIENPAAVTSEAKDPEAAQALLDFILTDEGQQIFADYGYRPVTESVLAQNTDKFPEVPGLFTIADFGGWAKADEEFFDDETGKVTQILRDQGAALE
ncbi:MAG TPA: sulfate ABC transporter substrate-binding protein [Solirubrobacterales bacterium]|nr:sulfate ABC transporter substrate-binding protein [Solirubrobacterales bacterium]